jgi:hypothetical protein
MVCATFQMVYYTAKAGALQHLYALRPAAAAGYAPKAGVCIFLA